MKLKINFVLKTGMKGEIPIIALINFGYKEFDALKFKYVYKPLKYYTGIKVKRQDWNETLKLPSQKSKQNELLAVQKTIEDVFQYLQMKNMVSNEAIRNELDIQLKGKSDEVVTKVRLVDFIEQEFVNRESYSLKTKQRFVSFVKRLKDFEKDIRKPLYSNDMNEQLYAQYMEKRRVDLKKQNSLWLSFADFKTVMRRIAKTYNVDVFIPTVEIAPNDRVRFLKFEEKVYLNFEQIQKVIKYEPDSERMRDTKLIFLTLLFTGCRYSDVFKVKPEFSYSKDGVSFEYARFITQKCDVEVVIPILKPLKDAWEQSGGPIVHQYTEVAFNLNVKELIR